MAAVGLFTAQYPSILCLAALLDMGFDYDASGSDTLVIQHQAVDLTLASARSHVCDCRVATPVLAASARLAIQSVCVVFQKVEHPLRCFRGAGV